MNHSFADTTNDDLSEEGSVDDLDALLENELALVDENLELEPEIESESIKAPLPFIAPFFEEFDGVMAELLSSSQSMFVGQEPKHSEEKAVQPIDGVILDNPTIDTNIESVQEFGLKDLEEDERNILLQLMELIVESVECSAPTAIDKSLLLSSVESVECTLTLFDEEHHNRLEEVVVNQHQSSAVVVPLDSELLRIQALTEGLIKNEETLGQAAISKVDEELLRETEKIAERNRKREKQRQLAQRNAMATRIQCWLRKLRARRKVQKLREFTARKRAVEAIQQQRRVEQEEADRRRREQEEVAQREKEQRERAEEEEARAEAARNQLRREEEQREEQKRQREEQEELARRTAVIAAREEALKREKEEQEAALNLVVTEVLAEEGVTLVESVMSEMKKSELVSVDHSVEDGFDLSVADPTEDHKKHQQYQRGQKGGGASSSSTFSLEEQEDAHLLFDSMDDSQLMTMSPHLPKQPTVICWDDSKVDLDTVLVPSEVAARRVNSVDYSYLDSLTYQNDSSNCGGLPCFASVDASCMIQLVPNSSNDDKKYGQDDMSTDLEETLRCWQSSSCTSSVQLHSDITSALSIKLTPSKAVRGKVRGVYYEATDFTKSVENLTSVEDIGKTYPNLVKLNLKVNLIRGLKGLDSLFRLQELNLNDNKIESVQEVNQLRYLQSLQLDSNSVRDIECLNGRLLVLTFLSLSMNKLNKMPTLQLPSLKRFELHHNELRDLPAHCLDHLPSLTLLDLGSNKLRHIDGAVFSRCPLLQSLILSHNTLSAVPSPLHLPLLKFLWLSGNQITDLTPWAPVTPSAKSESVRWPLFTPMLQRLVLTGNQISRLEPHILSTLPLLTDLDLSFNSLTSCHDFTSLREATALQVLHIQDNKVLNTVNPQTVTPESGQFKTKTDMQRWLLQLCPQLKKLFDEEIPRERQRPLPPYHSGLISRQCTEDREAVAVIGSLTYRHLLQQLSEFQSSSQCINAVLKLSSEDKPLAESNADVRLLFSQYQTLLGASATLLREGKEPSLLSLCRPVPLPVDQLIALQSAFRGYRVRRRLQEALSTLRGGGTGGENGWGDDDWGDEAEDNSLINDLVNIDMRQYDADFDVDSSSEAGGGVPMVYGDHIRKRKNSKRSVDEYDESETAAAAPARGVVPVLIMDDELSRPASASSEISSHSLPVGGGSGSAANTPYGSAAYGGGVNGSDRLHHYSNMSPLSSARSGVSGIADMNHRGGNRLINPNSEAAEWDNSNPGVLATLMRNPPRQRHQDSDNSSRATKTSTRPHDVSKKNPVSMSANTSNYVKSGSFGGKVIHVRRGHGGGGNKKVNKPAWLKGEDVEEVEES